MAKTKAKSPPKEKAPERQVREYKLLIGQHIGPDHTEEPAERELPDGTKVKKWPSRTYRAGETVPSEVDLVERFGAEKFQYLGDPSPDTVYFGTGSDQPGDPTPANVVRSPTVAPHGQVGTGHPEAVSGSGPVRQGPAGETTLEALGERQEEVRQQEQAHREEAEAEEGEEDEGAGKAPARAAKKRHR